jgi:hypothetical protein
MLRQLSANELGRGTEGIKKGESLETKEKQEKAD